MRICFASHNRHKVTEIGSIAPEGIEIYGLDALHIQEDIPETGSTMEENSEIKARYVHHKHQVPVFADDSGLEVRALNGAPGVYSARYAGDHKSDQDNMSLLLKNLAGEEDRFAQFKSVITFIDHSGEVSQFTGTVAGRIETERSGAGGFGYDPIFTPEGYSTTFAQMTPEEKNAFSHRAKAFHQLLAYLNQWNGDS